MDDEHGGITDCADSKARRGPLFARSRALPSAGLAAECARRAGTGQEGRDQNAQRQGTPVRQVVAYVAEEQHQHPRCGEGGDKEYQDEAKECFDHGDEHIATKSIRLEIMNAKKSLLVGAIVASMVLAGCSIGGDTFNGIESPNRGVTVQATGTAEVIPSSVSVMFAVTALADTSEKAVSDVARLADAARESLRESGVDEDEIRTRSVTTYPEYRYDADGSQTLIGYRATQSFAVNIDDADNAGEVVGALVVAVGDGLQIESVTPEIGDNEDALEVAREAAIRHARKKAKDYAELLGVDLGDVQMVTEVSSPITFESRAVGESADASMAKITIDLGKQEVSVTVEVRWSIK